MASRAVGCSDEGDEMPSYAEEMAARLPATLVLPEEFGALFDWMEENGFFMASQRFAGDRLGLLGTEDELQSGAVTAIMFRIETPEQARDFGEAWFRGSVPEIERRLVVFARTGGDGSYCGFWHDDDGRQRIVHLGSEGHVCLVGETPLDFLRLCAIGYSEISGDCLGDPDSPPDDETRAPNTAFRAWLTERYGVSIPETAREIVGDIPAGTIDETSDDPFWLWVRKHVG